jgi:hypothetical protein
VSPFFHTGNAIRNGIDIKLYKYANATNSNHVKWALPYG